MITGKLIVIEGLDGSGKGTQTDLLFQKLKMLNYGCKKISFPDYTQQSSALVKMYLNSELGSNPQDVNAYAASSFFAVDRFASFTKFWKNNYYSGDVIIADRYTTSNVIYHMNKLPQNQWDHYLSWLDDFEYSKLALPRPDLVIYLSVPVDVSQRLMTERYNGDLTKKDLHENDVDFLKMCDESANYAIEKLSWKKIKCTDKDGIKSIDKIQEDILLAVMEELNV